MGRPRKQPRRIVTFNLNLPLADAIDALPVKNRSQWMNDNLPAFLENRDAQEALKKGGEAALEEIADDIIFEFAESAGITDTFTTSRLIVLLMKRLNPDYKPAKFGLRKPLIDALNATLVDLATSEDTFRIIKEDR